MSDEAIELLRKIWRATAKCAEVTGFAYDRAKADQGELLASIPELLERTADQPRAVRSEIEALRDQLDAYETDMRAILGWRENDRAEGESPVDYIESIARRALEPSCAANRDLGNTAVQTPAGPTK